MSGQEKHFYQFGPFRLDPLKRRLLREGELVPLTPKAFDTLLALVQQSGKTIEKDDLMKTVWPGAVVEENNLNQSITALRKSLGDSRHESRYIATIPGFGYRFVADVSDVTIGKADESVFHDKQARSGIVTEAKTIKEDGTSLEADVTFVSREASVSSVNKKRLTTTVRRSVAILGLLVLAGVAYGLFIREKQPSPLLTITSIAVLPLENLSGDPAQEYFADGMTDTLIGDLAKIAELRVISRTSSMHYKGTKKSLPEIAGELKVDAVVEGTVHRSGDRVRVRAQLIHAATDRHLWVETYERHVRDVLSLQSDIAQAIAREVQIKLTPAEQARLAPRPPVHPKALDAYLQGRYLFWNKRTAENLHKALDYFQKAINEDPTYAPAYVAMADCYSALGSVQMGTLPPIEAKRRAEEAAVKALELDPGLGEAHTVLGNVKHYNWNWTAAEQEFKRAIEFNPNYANAHISYASYLMSVGRVDESIASSNRARELDPLSLAISVQRGFMLENARRYDEAIEQFHSVIAVDPNHYQAYWMLSHTYAVNGQFDQAISAGEKAVALSQRAPGALGILGMIYGLAGRKSEATKILKELIQLTERRYVAAAAVAWVYLGLGDKDQTFMWLEKAHQEGSYFLSYLKTVPVADPLRSDPRFDDLLRRIGLSK